MDQDAVAVSALDECVAPDQLHEELGRNIDAASQADLGVDLHDRRSATGRDLLVLLQQLNRHGCIDAEVGVVILMET